MSGQKTTMPAKKSRAALDRAPHVKLPGTVRRVEEVDFHDYVRNRNHTKYIEEIDIGAHLKKKKPPRTS
jgi:hypothetical protein